MRSLNFPPGPSQPRLPPGGENQLHLDEDLGLFVLRDGGGRGLPDSEGLWQHWLLSLPQSGQWRQYRLAARSYRHLPGTQVSQSDSQHYREGIISPFISQWNTGVLRLWDWSSTIHCHGFPRWNRRIDSGLDWGFTMFKIIILVVVNSVILSQINTIQRSARCQIGVNLDSHSFFKAPCY